MTLESCPCGCASCPPHRMDYCPHNTPNNPIDTTPTDIVKPIERPGRTIRKTLAQLLSLTSASPAAIEWRARMDDLDKQASSRSGGDS